MRLKNFFWEKLPGKLTLFCFYHFIKGDLHCACVVVQLTVGHLQLIMVMYFTGYYFNLNFGVFIARPFNYTARKTLQVSTISFYNILCYAFLIWVKFSVKLSFVTHVTYITFVFVNDCVISIIKDIQLIIFWW